MCMTMAQLLSIQPHSRHWLGLPAWSARFGRRTRTGVYAVLLAEHSGRAEVHSGFANSYFSIVPRFVDLRSASQLRICGLHLVVYLSSSASWSKAVQTRSSYGYPRFLADRKNAQLSKKRVAVALLPWALGQLRASSRDHTRYTAF